MTGKAGTAAIAVAWATGLGCAGSARGEVTYLTQSRSVSASTTVDGVTVTKAAPDFASFVDMATASATFVKTTGGTGTSSGSSGIDCQLDPNALKLSGRMAGSGGLALVGNKPVLELGEASVRVSVTFHLDAPTPYSLLASARPSDRAGDRFRLKFEGGAIGTIVLVDDSMAPQAVDLQGTLLPGDYALEYQAEFRGDGPEAASDYSLQILVPTPGAAGLVLTAMPLTLRRRR